MFPILYEIALWILALAAFPRMFLQRIFAGKYRNSLSNRFGFGFPHIEKKDRELIWIHAVSVGETKMVATLAKRFKSLANNPLVVVSSTTETGHTEALRSMPFADYHVYLPFDLYGIMSPIMKQVRPDIVIMAESDFWYNFMHTARREGAKIFVVNGKLSERSMRRFRRFSFVSKALFSCMDLICAQNDLYRERFIEAFVSPEKIVVTGNMKFDEVYPQLTESELNAWRRELGIASSEKVVVAGSTHDPEEQLLVEAMQKVWQEFPQVKLMLVPRHPERFPVVASLLERNQIPFVRFSELKAKRGNEKVVLVDAMGQLRKCYQLADLAVVCGSYTDKVGGHNIIEPCWYGVPVLFGPHMDTQLELVALVKQYQAGLQVPPEELSETLLTCLRDSELRDNLGNGGKRLVGAMQGAIDKTWSVIRAKG